MLIYMYRFRLTVRENRLISKLKTTKLSSLKGEEVGYMGHGAKDLGSGSQGHTVTTESSRRDSVSGLDSSLPHLQPPACPKNLLKEHGGRRKRRRASPIA